MLTQLTFGQVLAQMAEGRNTLHDFTLLLINEGVEARDIQQFLATPLSECLKGVEHATLETDHARDSVGTV
ncbi:MAG: hypothetical protein IPO08_22535 [Xanthomonadales bacterium]|nr:hypothetical protein [Xanthomonadales bacterium]